MLPLRSLFRCKGNLCGALDDVLVGRSEGMRFHMMQVSHCYARRGLPREVVHQYYGKVQRIEFWVIIWWEDIILAARSFRYYAIGTFLMSDPIDILGIRAVLDKVHS